MPPINISQRALYTVVVGLSDRIRVALFSLFQRTRGSRVCGLLCANLICTQVMGAGLNVVGQAPPSVYRLTFIVDPQLAAEIGPVEAGRRLMQYVADVNTVFARETVRRFAFDPATDIQWTFPSVATTPCGFNGLREQEVVICISKSAQGYSHSGLSLSWTFPQKGVVWNLQWTAIHDPLRLSRVVAAGALESTERDYLARQLKTFLHELEHVFGAGSGEYYSAAAVTDSTGVVPVTNLDLANETDWYWWTRQHWRLDPLLGNVFEERRDPAANRIAILEMIRSTEGTKASINTDWSDWPKLGTSKYMADMAAVQVRVSDRANGVRLSGTQVSVWRDPGAGKPLIPLRTGLTDESGLGGIATLPEFAALGNFRIAASIMLRVAGVAPIRQ